MRRIGEADRTRTHTPLTRLLSVFKTDTLPLGLLLLIQQGNSPVGTFLPIYGVRLNVQSQHTHLVGIIGFAPIYSDKHMEAP